MTGLFRRGSAIGLCVLFMGALSPIASAAEQLDPGGPTSVSDTSGAPTSESNVPLNFSLGVSPSRLVVGQTDIATAQQVRVSNGGSKAFDVSVQKSSYSVDSQGAVEFNPDASYAASEWIAVSPATFEIPAGGTQTVTATITLPANPEPGDHQFALVFVVPSGEGSGNIKLNKGIAIPGYITAPGPIDDSVSLSNLSAPGFATGGPVTITASMQSTGNVHRDFRGNSPLAVDAPGTTTPFPDFTVTRGATRDISTTWDPPLFGIFNPTVTYSNPDGSVQTASVRVVVFPVVPAIIFVGALLLLFLMIMLGRRGYRASVRRAAAAMQTSSVVGDDSDPAGGHSDPEAVGLGPPIRRGAP